MKWSLVAVILASLALVGCSEGDDIDAFIKDPGIPPGRIESLPKPKVYPTAEYNRDTIKDPFAAKLSLTREDAPDQVAEREALELFPLDGLRMIGFVHIDGIPHALIQDPELQVHRVRAGQKMGQNHGKVVRITLGGVDLIESIQDNAGGWLKSEASIVYTESDQVTRDGTRGRFTR
jgi:type IV pilus assembly protein PilP